MSADTRLGRGIHVPEPTEGLQVTPDAVKARIGDFFEGVRLGRNGVFNPDAIRTVTVRSTNVPDNDHRYPHLDGKGKIELFSRGRLFLREAAATVNGITFAREIIPAEPIIRFYENAFHSREIISSGNVTAIYELYGIYETPENWHAFPGKFNVAISVLDFDGGASRVFFPSTVHGLILPETEKVKMARNLGVKA